MPETAVIPWVIAHRGDHRQAAENSLASFDAAISGGCDMIETDLRRCRDGIVAHHDACVGDRPISSMSRREIRDETGVLPPALDDVVERCRGYIGLDLELKEEGLEAEVLAAVTPFFGPSQFFISSFKAAILRTVRNLHGATRTGLLSARGVAALTPPGAPSPDPRSADDILAARHACGADYLIPDALDHELIAAAADTGTALILWNANTDEQINEALGLPVVTGVITDSPHLMRHVSPTRSSRWARR
ncbi:MAG: glycerophosphodiester phosphodiesterase [Actinomycetota bacterium]